VQHTGIRFRYGDLDDVVNLLQRSPFTRQAYLPIWFPEDTGVHTGKRVPCTLGYHFMIRNQMLSCRYYIRSCDVIRHMPDDIYMAMLLQEWLVDKMNRPLLVPTSFVPGIKRGKLSMYASSMHAFRADYHRLVELMTHGNA
jgi:thymidylate synthase